MNKNYYAHIDNQIKEITDNKLFKHERIIVNPQNPQVILKDGKELLNFCANNYLGLADDADVIKSAKDALDKYGYGMASVRFICGTNQIHLDLEKAISTFLGFEDTILFSSCFDANGGLFETMLSAEDAVISDELNHASIIDGVRLCKAKRFRYKNNDMADLEAQLKAADEAGARYKLIATDGVFSMDGIIANLKAVCDLADKYNALVMVDDSHATGFTGKHGRGTPEYCGVEGRIDIMTGTLGKALGGASGGYISAKKNVIDLLRNRARPYLFSNSLAPTITAATLKVLEKVTQADSLREQLERNKKQFRDGMAKAGFDLVPGEHAIIPVMLYDEKLAVEFAQKLLDHGIYVIPFSFPVVPKSKARIRTQMSAKHTPAQIDKAIAAFTAVGKELGIVK
ncbi:MAG: glycine C-acetyltransferase [Neisseriaceae bacterium]|jgi:glycine C-acetyltransferase|nr:MAG: glycine C-acetyltransferase [Neisseriaceae bacterium]